MWLNHLSLSFLCRIDACQFIDYFNFLVGMDLVFVVLFDWIVDFILINIHVVLRVILLLLRRTLTLLTILLTLCSVETLGICGTFLNLRRALQTRSILTWLNFATNPVKFVREILFWTTFTLLWPILRNNATLVFRNLMSHLTLITSFLRTVMSFLFGQLGG